MKFQSSCAALGLVLLFSAVGCAPSQPYLSGFRFAPEPALAVMVKPGTQSPALSVLASVIGIRRGDPDKSVPPAVEIRMRFENGGKEPATFDADTLALVNGSLQSFMPPEIHLTAPPQTRPTSASIMNLGPVSTLTIGPGQSAMVSVFFPFPPGISPRMMALDALRLRWDVALEGKPYLQTVVFERTSPLYYDAP